MTEVRRNDEKEIMAKLALSDLERRARLLKAASGHPSVYLELLFFAVLIGAFAFFGQDLAGYESVLVFIAVPLIALAMGCNRLTNRRIDALIALLKEDNLLQHRAVGKQDLS